MVEHRCSHVRAALFVLACCCVACDGGAPPPPSGDDPPGSCPNRFVDGDGDGFGRGDAGEVVEPDEFGGCPSLPAGFVDNDRDCDDDDADVFPGGIDVVGDGVDQDCDGRDACYVDVDGDGFGGADLADLFEACAPDDDDCDDADAAAHPGAVEVGGNDVDEDCDGQRLCFRDGDGDGTGSGVADVVAVSCSDNGLAAIGDDCDDADPARSPLVAEVAADGVDQDCDGADACHADVDGDGFGDPVGLVDDANFDCADGPGTADANDCDDADAAVRPGAVEFGGNDVDEDCDGARDCFVDEDGDGVGSSVVVVVTGASCAGAAAVVDGDCDDHDAVRAPGHVEGVGDGVDEDCDGLEDCLLDRDGDGFGGVVVSARLPGPCDAPGSASVGGDCDDDDFHRFPGADEIVDSGRDEDCDGFELCPPDDDGDGFGGPPQPSADRLCAFSPDVAGDCDDNDDDNIPLGACDDGDPCTVQDSCRLGRCAGVPSPSCGVVDCAGNGCPVCNGVNGDCAQRCVTCNNDCEDGASCAFDGDGTASCSDASCDVVGSKDVDCDRAACTVDVEGAVECVDSVCAGSANAVRCVDSVCDVEVDGVADCVSGDCVFEQLVQGRVTCTQGSTCVVDLAPASQLICNGSSCDVDCDGAICDVDCTDASDCRVDCRDAVDRCDIECAEPPADCGDGFFVCGRACD